MARKASATVRAKRLAAAHHQGFKKVEAEVAAKGATDPAALAAWIGRRKYTDAGMAALAAAGRAKARAKRK